MIWLETRLFGILRKWSLLTALEDIAPIGLCACQFISWVDFH